MTIKIGLEVSNLHFMWGSLPAPIGLICGSCLTYFDPGEDRVAVGWFGRVKIGEESRLAVLKAIRRNPWSAGEVFKSTFNRAGHQLPLLDPMLPHGKILPKRIRPAWWMSGRLNPNVASRNGWRQWRPHSVRPWENSLQIRLTQKASNRGTKPARKRTLTMLPRRSIITVSFVISRIDI